MYLNCKSWFSFRYGTLSTEQLVQAAVAAGIDSLALTNINSTCDVWDFIRLCRMHGLRPIVGAEIRQNDQFRYLLLARNHRGLQAIQAFLSFHLQSNTPFPEPQEDFHCFAQEEDGYILFRPQQRDPQTLKSYERIAVQAHELNKLYGIPKDLLQKHYLALQPVTFNSRSGYDLHKLLRAISYNILWNRLSAEQTAHGQEWMVPLPKLLEAFQAHPYLITNAYQIADACIIDALPPGDKTKQVFSTSRAADKALLSKLAYDGCAQRYGSNPTAEKRLEKELQIIDQLGYNAYFLITWDLVRYAQSKGYYYVGRGSGANSMAAYCLYITDVDPLELDLYFERFLNPYRTSPPDFDIDFSWTDRDDVIDYVFKRYGQDHVALLGMYSTFQFNAAVRELGKVFGLPKSEIDALAQRMKPGDALQENILKYAGMMENMPNHLSIHPGGILISEMPITQYTALEMPPKGFPTAQIDMHVAENIGLQKFDVLSQRGLGHIREALRLIRENKQVNVQIQEVAKFKQDPAVQEQLRKADTIGCFYVESPAMRQLLQKLRCSDYLTLVAASSIIRPGVSSSGMMRAYIERFHEPEKVVYIHPIMKELLQETYGVMVYQEDVIKVAHHFAGLDMGEADILRRAMSGKYRGNKEMLRIRDQFFSNCAQKGYPPEITQEVWRQIASFGGYSFSKAHSASFAVESFQSLYLKTYYPKEFMVAVINNFGGFYSRELYFYELQKTGAAIHPPCVNESALYTSIRGNDVYVGFIHIRSLETGFVEKILSERSRCGRFLHLQDFIERVKPPLEQLNLLIRLNAFRFSGKNKKQLLWEANFLQKRQHQAPQHNRALFGQEPVTFQLPAFRNNPIDDLMDQVELLGFPLHSPFPLVNEQPELYVPAKRIGQHVGETITVLGYLITTKPVRTARGDRMCFGTFIDAQLQWIDTVHFPDILEAYPLSGSGFYKLTGKVVSDFDVYSIEISYLEKVGLKKQSLSV